MKKIERYISIFENAEAELSFRKSRFIACLFPAANEEVFQQGLTEVKGRYPKATHYCYAVICDTDGHWERMSDDGEPSGTAGRPILDVLRGSGLTNAALVVVRYFGGTLLGTGGLVRAYSDTAKEVLKRAEKVCMCPACVLLVQIEYMYYNQFESKCRAKLIGETTVEFLEKVVIRLHIPVEEKENLCQQLLELTNRTAEIEEEGIGFVPLPVEK